MLNINDADAIDKMGHVEGDQWRKQQAEWAEGRGFNGWIPSESVAGVRNYYRELVREAAESGYTLQSGDMAGAHAIIYGEGGYSRYFVRHTGEVVLLADTTHEDKIARADEIGIAVRNRPQV